MSNHQPQFREKLLACGAASLSDIELLAIIISSGSQKKSCFLLAAELIKHQGDLRSVLNCSYSSFSSIKGLGLAKFSQLQAAKEICKRSDYIQLQKDVRITTSQQSFRFLKRQLRDYRNETFAALFLDSQHRVLAFEQLFSGTVTSAAVFMRPIVDRVLQLNAATIIIAHNHPSGVSDPSTQDLEVTQKIKQAMELIDVRLLDHIVVGDNEIYSIINGSKWACA